MDKKKLTPRQKYNKRNRNFIDGVYCGDLSLAKYIDL